MSRAVACLLLAALAGGAAGAAPAGPPPPAPPVQCGPQAPCLEQHPGARLPLEVRLVDSGGRSVRLGSYFGAVPVLLVLGYYRCPNLCSTVLDSVLQSLPALAMPPARFRVLAVSIDPAEGPALAARRQARYLPLVGRTRVPLDFLTGAPPALARLAAATGFRSTYDASVGQYRHPAGFLVVTGDGRIARYFPGVGFSVPELRLALLHAAAGATSPVADRIALVCAHVGQLAGRYPGLAWNLVRAACLLVLALLAGGLWRLARQARRPG